MPDKFVPYDSTQNTDYFNELITSRALREFTMGYYLKHREQLEATTLNDYINKFIISDNMLVELMEGGNDLGVEFNEEDFQASKNHIKAYVKAEIARSVWDDAGFYPIYNNISNESFAKALTLFDQAQALVSNQ